MNRRYCAACGTLLTKCEECGEYFSPVNNNNVTNKTKCYNLLFIVLKIVKEVFKTTFAKKINTCYQLIIYPFSLESEFYSMK